MGFTKKNYIDLTGLTTFKTAILSTAITDVNKTNTKTTATIKAIADYVDSEVGDLSDAVTTALAGKVSSVSYDSTNKKLIYNKGGSTNTDIVSIATIKSDIGNFVKSGTGASSGLVPAPSTTAGTSKYLREDGTWTTPPDTTYTASSGITLDGKIFKHSNSITAGTASEGGSARTLAFGDTFKVPSVTYDAQGHVTGTGSVTLTMPANPNTDTHYTAKNVVASSDTGIINVNDVTSDPYLNLIENGVVRSTHHISGSGATSVKTDASGNIIISSTDNNTTYSAGTGISLSGTTFSNSGVRSIATGLANGTISVNTNGTSADVAVKGLGSNAYTSTEYIPASTKGSANGVASLGSDGKVPSSQLPSYVDDVLEYTAKSGFPKTGETGKIYVDTETNLTYRWSGSAYVEISPSIALGETSSTAYAGDKGATLATNLSSHTGNTDNPHGVTKAQLGLGNVDNTSDADKPISTATQTALNKKANTFTVTNGGNTASWGESVTVGTVAETDLKFTMPSNPNVYTQGYCTTASATGAKVVNCTGYTLTAKTYLMVVFTNANTATSGLTLNVNGKGAKSLYINGSACSSTNYSIPAGSYLVYYDGTNYYLRTDGKITTSITGSSTSLATSRSIDGVNFNGSDNITHYGTCSTAAGTAAKTVSCTGFTLVTGAKIAVKFTVTNTASSPTLNVNSTGAKAIYYRGSAISAGYLAADRTYEFVYNGTQYELIGDLDTNTDTHYKATPVLGASDSTSNATSATANASTYLNIVENSAKSGGIQIKGSGATTVSAINGILTISSTDTNTTYSNKTATSGGTDVSLVTTGEKYTWNSKADGSHTHTKSQITDFPSSMPASDVYSWAKASSKPSYSWDEITSKPSTFTPASHTHSYLPLSGGTMTGTITTPENTAPALQLRNNTSYRSTINYDTSGNEALAVNLQNSLTSFMVNHGVDGSTWTANGKWTGVTPSLQVKSKSVYINELIPNGTTPEYNLKVNGSSSLNGTVKIAEKVTLQYNSSTESLDFVFA